ncbi:hypothetical protein GV829_04520 [Sphingomonas lacunae]|uniref:Uncharacterized protein n=1 Tax=Sphingomonas lacunae TaxID=2698828 RepID=A0A6M4AUQ7_9SPHN|nr:hypothetical protein [Sphingomonas lacunae]QJQ31799.1 hypothetical protein GV829_04520 [Sphingomonas lacunae]
MTAQHHPAGQPLAIFTRAFESVIRVRLDQQQAHGHTLDQDVQAGAHRLIDMAHGATLRAARRMADAARDHQQMALDQTIGSIDALTDRDIHVIYARLAKSAALTIAAMDVLDALRATRQEKSNAV